MDDILANLENILSTGYSILAELQEENPDIDRVEALYEQRGRQLDIVKQMWQAVSENKPQMETDHLNSDEFKNMFLRLNLLEKHLNRNLLSLKKQKADVLTHIRSLQTAKNSYTAVMQNGSASLFVDLKSSR